MSRRVRIGWRHGPLGLALAALLVLAAVRLCVWLLSGEPEIALLIGEPYESMRQRSSATIDPAIPNEIWYNIPHSDARLRLIDKQYGFVTPLARFFTVSYIRGVVDSVRMSPQIEPLLLDDALKILLDLQTQWRQKGWKPFGVEDDPPFANTPAWHAQLRACQPSTTYWQADDKYQTLLTVACFRDKRHPKEQRYLITLALARPWLK